MFLRFILATELSREGSVATYECGTRARHRQGLLVAGSRQGTKVRHRPDLDREIDFSFALEGVLSAGCVFCGGYLFPREVFFFRSRIPKRTCVLLSNAR